MKIGAIDIGGTKTMVAIISENGEILVSRKFKSEEKDWAIQFDRTVCAFQDCVQSLGRNSNALEGIGINMPGIVDAEKGVLLYAPFQNWRNISVKKQFEEALSNVNIQVENDVNACAIGELVFGGARGTDEQGKCNHFAWITLSTGNGGALVANGELVRGYHGFAGEFGHLKVEFENPRLCPCGQYGCLEAYSSGTAIGHAFKCCVENEKKLGTFKFLEVKLDALGASILAREGYLPAIRIYEEAGKYLGRALSYVVNIANPEKIFLGGGVADSLDLLLPSIKKELAINSLNLCETTKILRTKLGYHAAILGAAALVLK